MPRIPDLPVNHFRGADGAALAYRETGEGRPVILIHGFFSTAYVNWIRYGHARLREAVFGGFTRAVLDHAALPVLMAH